MITDNIPIHLKGLNDAEVNEARMRYGSNELSSAKGAKLWGLLLDIFKEPMLIILVAVSLIYMLIGDYAEAIFMIAALIAVSAISFYQDRRSQDALKELEKLNEPLSTVIRNGEVVKIPTEEIVVGDLCIVEEGRMVNADGEIVHSNDFSVNESALTGETYSVFKTKDTEDNKIYNGTLVVSGLAIFRVESVGASTRLGEIGDSLSEIEQTLSPLQKQIRKFVLVMAIIGGIIFLMVCVYSYIKTGDIMESLLVGLTLAMSVLPEEIPVAFTTFMALGAWKLMREGVIIKRSSVVETLGSTTVICADKTGTITENSMDLKFLYDYASDKLYSEEEYPSEELEELISYAMWASEPVPFNPMEKTIHRVYESSQKEDMRRSFKMTHEYPLEGIPPMMTHLLENADGKRLVAAKGAPEAVIRASSLDSAEKDRMLKKVNALGKQGYRVLAVANAFHEGDDFPESQEDFNFHFLGFTVFYDPPKAGIKEVFDDIAKAGIQLKVITGDNPDTTRAIAMQGGIVNDAPIVQGKEILHYTEEELIPIAEETTLFTRMFPESKLAVVNALKAKGEVVAMLGDGVNDAPALKAAHIGVAMGTKGTEIAKAAASLIITNDNLDRLIVGIAAGRRIYSNLKKAIQYIISIHIPIMLAVALPLFLGWIYPEIFTPVHVIFLELIMGPTCSIVYENEPMEKDMMLRKPRKMTDAFLTNKELLVSIVQGLAITAGVLYAYQWTAQAGGSEEKTRAMVFTTLVFANIWLSFANRSFYYSIWESLKNRNDLLTGITILTLVLLMVILFVEPIAAFFKLSSLTLGEIGFSLLVAGISVLWIEVYKLIRRKRGVYN